MPPAFFAVPDQMTVTEDMHMMGQRRLGNLKAFQNMSGTLFPISQHGNDLQPDRTAESFIDVCNLHHIHRNASIT